MSARCTLPALAVLLSVAGLSPPPCRAQAEPSTPSPSAAEYFADGQQLVEAGQFDAGIRHLQRAVAGQPGRREYVLALVRAYERSGQRGPAVRLLETLRAAQPNDVELAEHLAALHCAAEDWTAAHALLAPLERVLTPTGLLCLADCCGRVGPPQAQLDVLSRGVVRFPSEVALRDAQARWALQHGQAGRALSWLREAERNGPLAPRLLVRRAQAYLQLQQVLGRVELKELNNAAAGQFIGDWLVLERQGARWLCCPRESALFALRRALDAGCDEPAAHVLHVRIWDAAERPDLAWSVFQARAAQVLAGADDETLALLARVALRGGQIEDYLRLTRRRGGADAERTQQLLVEAYLAVAQRAAQRGEDAMYLEFLGRAHQLRPDDLALLVRLADAEWDAGRTTAAIEHYRRIVERGAAPAELSRALERLEQALAAPKPDR